MRWKISFYSEKVREQALALPDGILANFLHIAEMIEEFGPRLGKPFVRSMGNGLFQIRAKGKEGIGRFLYCMGKGTVLVILHAYVKKTRKTPIRDLKLARRRMKEVEK
jgi:phage-related protein